MAESVLYETSDNIATITLNRPENLNAMDASLLSGTLAALERAAGDDDVRAVILTGAGRGFCSGGDLRAAGTLGDGDLESRIGVLQAYERSSRLLHEMPKVTIAAVNGACAGAGLSWACAADLRYAAESARFVSAFATAGLSGDFGGTWTLPRIVGSARAREMYLLGDRVSAEDAERIGLVSKMLPDEELMPYVRSVAERLTASAPIAITRIKQNLNDADEITFAEALNREADRHVRTGGSDDSREARVAFTEKRAPNFTGR
ncbi:MAG: enoyl-CoA hydratase [Dehalococcoidia bacterium]|nr:enoyl-CoA hydratase [Dehalococcoidia bacterium]